MIRSSLLTCLIPCDVCDLFKKPTLNRDSTQCLEIDNHHCQLPLNLTCSPSIFFLLRWCSLLAHVVHPAPSQWLTDAVREPPQPSLCPVSSPCVQSVLCTVTILLVTAIATVFPVYFWEENLSWERKLPSSRSRSETETSNRVPILKIVDCNCNSAQTLTF